MRKTIFKSLKRSLDFGGKRHDGRSCIIIIEPFATGICTFLHTKMNTDVTNTL